MFKRTHKTMFDQITQLLRQFRWNLALWFCGNVVKYPINKYLAQLSVKLNIYPWISCCKSMMTPIVIDI